MFKQQLIGVIFIASIIQSKTRLPISSSLDGHLSQLNYLTLSFKTLSERDEQGVVSQFLDSVVILAISKGH
jgi:hypothetical protein